MFKVAVFVSGRGSNLKAIVNSKALTHLVKIRYVVSDNPQSEALDFAESKKIETLIVGKRGIAFQTVAEKFLDAGVDLVVLAGFLKLVPVDFVEKLENQIINIHPALLPRYGGKGMYGHFIHEAVFNAGDNISGATVHFVNSEYDRGEIIKQVIVDITEAKTPEEIAKLVLAEEHKLLPAVIALFAKKKIKIVENRVRIIDSDD